MLNRPEHPAVLLALILVAAVANLNLAVANVALPSIGEAFDSSQTTLDLIAVGYSLGLAASVLYLGALGDRHGRKLMLIVGTALAIPACLLAAYAPTDIVLFVARVLGGLAAGMAYPTTLALITALWSGPATHEVDRVVVGARWGDLGARTAALRVAARALLVGIGLPAHAAARGRGARAGVPARSGPRERDDRPGRQPRRHPVGGAGRGPHPGDQLRAGPQRRDARPRARRHRRRGAASRSSSASAAPATPCTTCTSRGGASSGSRRAPASSCSAR